jgi:cytochrome c oxidase subunit IV
MSDNQEHILSFQKLFMVLLALFSLTGITIWVSTMDMGALNIWVALGIASTKGLLVLLFFMHLRWESRFLKIGFAGTIICLAVLIGLIFFDISFR